jgi:uncharacterized LabA/DUF88 family protein
MTRVAVLIDLSFFLFQYGRHRHPRNRPLIANDVARAVCSTARAHLTRGQDALYRILVYDCRPLTKKAHNPVSRRAIDFAKTETCAFRTELLQQLVCMRKVALRLGELADRQRWIIRAEPTRRLLNGSLKVSDLRETDVTYDIEQKGVDIKMSIDIASLAYKRLVDRLVLITGDSDFVPAAKLARREGLDVILDPLWAPITPSLNEHIDGLRTRWPRGVETATSSSA